MLMPKGVIDLIVHAHPECLFGIMSDSFITQVWTSLNHLEYEVIIHARLSLSAGKLSVYICVGYNLLLGLTVLVVVVFYMLSVYILVRYNICPLNFIFQK